MQIKRITNNNTIGRRNGHSHRIVNCANFLKATLVLSNKQFKCPYPVVIPRNHISRNLTYKILVGMYESVGTGFLVIIWID